MSSSVPEVVKKTAESSHKMKENSVKVSLKLKEAKTVVETKMAKKRSGIAKNRPGIALNRPKMSQTRPKIAQTRPKMALSKSKNAKKRPEITLFGSDVNPQEPCELLSHILPAKWSLEPAMPNPTTKIEPDITTAVADGKKLPTSNFLSANPKTNVSTAALDSTSATNFGNFSKTAKPKPKVSTMNLYNLSKKTFQNEEQFLAFKLETNSGPSSRPNPILGPRFTPKPLLIGNRLLAPQILDMKRFAGAITQQMTTTDKIVEEKGNLNLSLKILVTSNLCKPLNLL